MRSILLFIVAAFCVVACQSEDKKQEQPVSSTAIAEAQHEHAQTIAPPAIDQSVLLADSSGSQPVNNPVTNNDSSTATQLTTIKTTDPSAAADPTATSDDDVNPYSLQQMQQQSPQPADKPAATAATTNDVAKDDHTAHSEAVADTSAPQHTYETQPPQPTHPPKSSDDEDFNFDDLPVPVSIDSRAVSVQQPSVSSVQGEKPAATKKGTVNNQQLQKLIDQYDDAQQKQAAAQAGARGYDNDD